MNCNFDLINESLFLNEEENNNDYYIEEPEDLMCLTLESEMSWNNIIRDCMLEEGTCILNEGNVVSAILGFFKRVLEWVVEKIKAIGQFFKNLFASIFQRQKKSDEYVKKVEERINLAGGSGNTYIKKPEEVEYKQYDLLYDPNKFDQLGMDLKYNKGDRAWSVDELCKAIVKKNFADFNANNMIHSFTKIIKMNNDSNAKSLLKTSKNDLETIHRKQKTLKDSQKGLDSLLKVMKDLLESDVKFIEGKYKDKPMPKKELEKCNHDKNILNTYKAIESLSERSVAIEVTYYNKKELEVLKVIKRISSFFPAGTN